MTEERDPDTEPEVPDVKNDPVVEPVQEDEATVQEEHA